MHRGLSRALKVPHWGIFSGRDVPWVYGLAVTASACAPWAGLVLCDRCACSGSLFPLQAAVTSTASHSRPQWCTNGSSLKNIQ